MLRIHKTYPYLISSEALADIQIDLAYRVPLDYVFNPPPLVVDYDLSRIHRMRPERWLCGELEDVEGSFNRLLMHVAPFDSIGQIQRDIFAATTLLSPAGEMRVVLPLKWRTKKIESITVQCFRSVFKAKSKGAQLFICQQPILKEKSPNTLCVSYHDAVSGKELHFYARPGMFSSSQIDKGTELLLQTISSMKDKSVLDVGCGYGAISVVTAARGATVSLLDVDARAIKLALRNMHFNGYEGKAYLELQPYDFADGQYNIVLSNPPTHSGSATLQHLFSEMVRVSSSDGYVVIVVREQLNYEKWLVKLGSVTVLAISGGYKIIRIVKG